MRKKQRRALVVLTAVLVVTTAAVVAAVKWPRRAPPVLAPSCGGATVKGIDVSYYQGTVQWRRVRKAGVVFSFVRVSDGATLADPRFAANWRDAKAAGVLRGAYQYFRPNENPEAQADLLIAALKKDRGDLPPVLDIETSGGVKPAVLAERAQRWLERVRDALHVEPIVYTAPLLWRDLAGSGREFGKQPLWVAHYTDGCPLVPAPWTAWHFWQYSDRGEVHGIDTPVDLNLFAGTYEELEHFARRTRIAYD